MEKKIMDQKNPTGVILVAEDNENDALILRHAFKKARLHSRVCFVSTGEEAIHYLEGEWPYNDRREFPPPNLLLLDLTMPPFDGLDLLSWLRSSPEIHEMPVVVLTDSVLDKDRRMAAQLGASKYYVKDGDPDKTVQMLLEICRKYLNDSPDASTIPACHTSHPNQFPSAFG